MLFEDVQTLTPSFILAVRQLSPECFDTLEGVLPWKNHPLNAKGEKAFLSKAHSSFLSLEPLSMPGSHDNLSRMGIILSNWRFFAWYMYQRSLLMEKINSDPLARSYIIQAACTGTAPYSRLEKVLDHLDDDFSTTGVSRPIHDYLAVHVRKVMLRDLSMETMPVVKVEPNQEKLDRVEAAFQAHLVAWKVARVDMLAKYPAYHDEGLDDDEDDELRNHPGYGCEPSREYFEDDSVDVVRDSRFLRVGERRYYNLDINQVRGVFSVRGSTVLLCITGWTLVHSAKSAYMYGRFQRVPLFTVKPRAFDVLDVEFPYVLLKDGKTVLRHSKGGEYMKLPCTLANATGLARQGFDVYAILQEGGKRSLVCLE